MQGLASFGAFTLLFVGCSVAYAEPPRTPPADARPTEICVLHMGAPGGDATYVVRDNGNLVATVGQGYFCFPAPPGSHHVVVEVGPRSAAVDVTIAGGERIFLQESSSAEAVTLARLSEAAPVSSPGTAGPDAKPSPAAPSPAAAPPAPAPPAAAHPAAAAPPAPASLRRRPEGMVYGIDAGIGVASSRLNPAPQATPSFTALGSILIGFWPNDSTLLGGRIDASLVNGSGVADIAAHLAIFPGTARSGPLHGFLVFADVGAAVPISSGSGLSTAPPIAGMGRIGFGWQRFHIGPALVGPLFCGQIVEASGEAYAAVLGGLTASLDTQGPPK